MSRYHAHVYFRVDQIEDAHALGEKIRSEHSPPLHFYKLFDCKVGPHALPMIEVHFDGADKRCSIDLLNELRGSFSILIHEDTGDDLHDHTHVTWLGASLPIDFAFFELIRRKPDLAVHP